jgi:flagellar hook assembly protein FlgD
MAHNLSPHDTLLIVPSFDDTRMRNSKKEEVVAFALETIDSWQASYYDTAFVRLKSKDEIWLDKNVFRGDQHSSLMIRFRMSTNRHAKIAIHDIAGTFIKTVADGMYLAGWNQTSWDGRNNQGQNVGSGIYVALYSSGDVKKAYKFIVVR